MPPPPRPLNPPPTKPSRQRPPATLCHLSIARTAYTFYTYEHQPPMKAAREVRHRTTGPMEAVLLRRRAAHPPWRPRNPPPTTRRASNLELSTLPPHGRRASANPGGGAPGYGSLPYARATTAPQPSPRVAVAPATASDPALPRATSAPSSPVATSPHSVVSSAAPSAWPPGRRTRPCWSSCSVPPPGATPSSPICGRHPLGQPARQGTQTEVNRRRTIQQLRQGRPRRETIAVLPPRPASKVDKKTQSNLTQGD